MGSKNVPAQQEISGWDFLLPFKLVTLEQSRKVKAFWEQFFLQSAHYMYKGY